MKTKKKSGQSSRNVVTATADCRRSNWNWTQECIGFSFCLKYRNTDIQQYRNIKKTEMQKYWKGLLYLLPLLTVDSWSGIVRKSMFFEILTLTVPSLFGFLCIFSFLFFTNIVLKIKFSFQYFAPFVPSIETKGVQRGISGGGGGEIR